MYTEKLYYDDGYIKTFEAKVLSCLKIENNYLITLDKTAFYPEGGGQPSDIGTLDDIDVIDVQEKNEQIFHTTSKPLFIGKIVVGEINWNNRFSLMQHHTGEHIVSGIVKRCFGYDNVGFAMGSEFVTMDFNHELTKENIEQIEIMANEAVYKNIDINVEYPNFEQLSTLDYRSKKELKHNVRIVTIPEYDTCACCGIHTATTGEIGIIKLAWWQKYKSGTRVYMLCGKKAFLDYSDKNRSVYAISSLLSAKVEDVAYATKRLLDENSLLNQNIVALRKQIILYKVSEVDIENKNTCVFDEELSISEIRQFCLLLCEKTEQASVFSGSDKDGYKYAIGSHTIDVRLAGRKINAALNGQGGGTKQLFQGFVKCSRKEIEKVFQNMFNG